MKQFDTLKSGNDYIDYTIKNYVRCYNNLNEDSINRFTELFDYLKEYEISIGNTLINNKSLQGVTLKQTKNKKTDKENSHLEEQLYAISSTVSEKKDILFYKSVVCLCDSVSYLTSDEMFQLNNLFNSIQLNNSDLNSPIISENSIFYSYNRYPHIKK